MDWQRDVHKTHLSFEKARKNGTQAKTVECFQANHKPADLKEKVPYIDYPRDNEMKRQMNVIEKGDKHVNALLLSIFADVGAWHVFPTFPGIDYLALLLSTHLKRDARFRLTPFPLQRMPPHSDCSVVQAHKVRGMLRDHSARLGVASLLNAFPHPYDPDGKNYSIPHTVSSGPELPHFERTDSGCNAYYQALRPLTGFTCADEIMDSVVARAVSFLMFNSNAGEGGRFCVPPGDHLSQGLGSTARVEKVIEVYERDRDRFAALTPDFQRCSMLGQFGPNWPVCRETFTLKRHNKDKFPRTLICGGETVSIGAGLLKCTVCNIAMKFNPEPAPSEPALRDEKVARLQKTERRVWHGFTQTANDIPRGKAMCPVCPGEARPVYRSVNSVLQCTLCELWIGLTDISQTKAPLPSSPPCSPPAGSLPGSPTPPASPMGDVEPPPPLTR